ncbi:MAG: hypothetical protein KKA42_17155, partial [candidate division Zixibacteria bacterium]|nr:hypothetical protein [candidate division Zixibacteria bacterium]
VDAGTVKAAAKPAETSVAPPAPSYSRTLNIAQVRAGWENFLTFFRKKSAMLASQLSMAEVGSVKEDRLELRFSPSEEASMQLVTKPEASKSIQDALREHFQANLQVRFDIDEAKPANGSGKEKQPAVDPKDLVKQSPRLKSLLAKVDGEIIGIKKVDD